MKRQTNGGIDSNSQTKRTDTRTHSQHTANTHLTEIVERSSRDSVQRHKILEIADIAIDPFVQDTMFVYQANRGQHQPVLEGSGG